MLNRSVVIAGLLGAVAALSLSGAEAKPGGGASSFAPGQQTETAKSMQSPGRSYFAPGQQAKRTGRSARLYAPGQRMPKHH